MISFSGRHFPKDVIMQGVRWYVAYSLSYRDIEELMKERGVCVDHATLNRWVIYYAPLLENEFRQHHKPSVGSSWRMDETYIKVQGEWCYLYRAVDKAGKTIDFMLSPSRDKLAAKQFFKKALGSRGIPEKITIDKRCANKAGIRAINILLLLLTLFGLPFFNILIRQVKYLNNIVEQDHRGIKRIVKPMLGFKAFYSAEATLTGIELHRMLRKKQHKTSENQSVFQQFYALAA